MRAGVRVDEWGHERLGDVVGLLDAGRPHDRVDLEELAVATGTAGAAEAPATSSAVEAGDGASAVSGVVLGTDDGLGAVVVRVHAPFVDAPGHRPSASTLVAPEAPVLLGSVAVVVVHPAARRAGRGGALLEAAERWARSRGASALQVGGGPLALWSGVDGADLDLVGLLGSRGYAPSAGGVVAQDRPVADRRLACEGIEVRRVRMAVDVEQVRALCSSGPGGSAPDLERALHLGTCHGAFAVFDDRCVGYVVHSTARGGVVAPPVVAPGAGAGAGVGGIGPVHAVLVGAACRDLDLAEFTVARVHVAAAPTVDGEPWAEGVVAAGGGAAGGGAMPVRPWWRAW